MLGTVRQLPKHEAGFALLEVLIGAGVLAMAMLAHVASSVYQHRLAREEFVRSDVLAGVRQFMERLHADEDFDGLYARLRLVQDQAGTYATGALRLTDGRRTFAPTTYFSDFRDGDGLGVLVDVPHAADRDDAALQVLREDAVVPRYMLPGDLDGDGVIDDQAHDGDYKFLPVVVWIAWTVPGRGTREMRVATWLRGER